MSESADGNEGEGGNPKESNAVVKIFMDQS